MRARFTTIQIISQIRTELDRLVDAQSELSGSLSDSQVLPTRLDIVETKTTIIVLIEVPGVSAPDLEVTVTGSQLTVTGERGAPQPTLEGNRYLCVERQWGRFERHVELPATINPRHGKAVLGHGVLRIEFPVLSDQRNRPVRLQIEDANGGELE